MSEDYKTTDEDRLQNGDDLKSLARDEIAEIIMLESRLRKNRDVVYDLRWELPFSTSEAYSMGSRFNSKVITTYHSPLKSLRA